jgi:hypothetical protein
MILGSSHFLPNPKGMTESVKDMTPLRGFERRFSEFYDYATPSEFSIQNQCYKPMKKSTPCKKP